uniref:Uncharacterized protein n=1 Tax=Acrobeloides nanus TaxID=290746 RepID=A0A914E0Z6_9BILA
MGLYLFYKTPNDSGYLPLLVDTIIYLFPILLCVIYPCFVMVYAKPYRTYLLSYMPKCLKKSKKMNNTVFIAEFLYK